MAFEIKRGYAITFMYATDDVIRSWAMIKVPYSLKVAERLSIIQKKNENIVLNIQLVESDKATN